MAGPADNLDTTLNTEDPIWRRMVAEASDTVLGLAFMMMIAMTMIMMMIEVAAATTTIYFRVFV